MLRRYDRGVVRRRSWIGGVRLWIGGSSEGFVVRSEYFTHKYVDLAATATDLLTLAAGLHVHFLPVLIDL